MSVQAVKAQVENFIAEQEEEFLPPIPSNIDAYALDEADLMKHRDPGEKKMFFDVWGDLKEAQDSTGIPWEHTRLPVKLSKGEVSLWTGDPGIGKSTFLGQLAAGICHREKVYIVSPEMPVRRTLRRMVTAMAGRMDITQDYCFELLRSLSGRIVLLDEDRKIYHKRLFALINYAQQELACTHVIVDSLMMLRYSRRGSRSDFYHDQSDFMQDLVDLAKYGDIHIHLVAHQRKTGDRNRKSMEDIAGTMDLANLSANVFLLQNNHIKEAEENKAPSEQDPEILEQPDVFLKVDKTRNHDRPKKAFAFWFKGSQFRSSRTKKWEAPIVNWSDESSEG